MATAKSPRPIAPEATGRPLQELVVIGCGFFTSVVTALLLALVESKWGFAIYTWSFWFVIPVGALLAGFAGASGYYAGAKFFGHRPGRLLLLGVVLISTATFFLVHYLEYWWLEIDGTLVRDRIPFLRYLDIVIRSASMEFRYHAAKIGSTGEMGAFGYVPAILQILGFAFGGFTVFALLSTEPYCDSCSRYLTRGPKTARFTGDTEKFQLLVGRLVSLFNAGDLQGSIKEHSEFGQLEPGKGDHLRSTIEIRRCKTCTTNWLKFTVAKMAGNDWKELSELTFETYSQAPLTLPR